MKKYSGYLDFVVKVFYPRRSVDIDVIRRGAARLANLFSDLDVSLVSMRGSAESLHDVRSVADEVLVSTFNKDREVVFSDASRKIFDCTYSASDSHGSITSLHDQVTLSMDDCFSTSPEFLGKLIEFLKEAVSDPEAHFAYACNVITADQKYGIDRAGLSRGLRDVYWVTIFGAPFVELIGHERLMALGAVASVEELSESMIMVRLESPQVHDEQKRTVKQCIGAEYFVNSSSTPGFAKKLLSFPFGGKMTPRARLVPKFEKLGSG